MATYKVVSKRLVGLAEGATVSDTDLDGANIAALIEGGHLAPIGSRPPKKNEAEGQEK
jgi:hypothetical protein